MSAVLLACLTPLPSLAGEHPALLLRPADMDRLRHVCGVAASAAPDPKWRRYGARAADYQALREGLADHPGDEALPGELLAAAFLHLMDPSDPRDRGRLSLLNAALPRATTEASDTLEAVLALDWCWRDIEPSARREFLLNMRLRVQPLTVADSPLDARRFREKLAALALALAVDETDEPSPSWIALRAQLLEAGRTYFATTFPTYVAWRGLSPTGPAAAAREECDTALAIEFARRLAGPDPWTGYRATVGRWMEHYVLATLEHPALGHNFVRDDANAAPLTPAPEWRDLLPVTAHLIAARTGDPAAALLARRVEQALSAAAAHDPATAWRWVPIVLDCSDIPACDAQRLPTARNLGGAVILRAGTGPDATAVWIDAAQPFLRRRQHFDAGHFLVRRGGELTVHGGDDVLFEAVRSKGGAQHLGREREPFEFEQYYVATIAHNALLLWDPIRVPYWYKQRYLPVGGQRCIEDTCTDFVTPLTAQGRRTGRQLAYGQRGSAAYLALDLAAAYEQRAITAYTREFVFVWGRALVLIDRVSPARGRSVPTWILNVPSRPLADGEPLGDGARVAGSTNEAGVWRCDGASWLRWTDRDGGLWFSAPLPAQRSLRVVGGPAERQVIQAGRFAGRTWAGGEPDGFEHLIIPAERHGPHNAWYRLGDPTLLGPRSGKTPHWGRIELEPAAATPAPVFLTVLIADRADATETPTVTLEQSDGALVLRLRHGPDLATLHLPPSTDRGGRLEAGGKETFTWELPTEVEADRPLAIGGDA